MQTKNEPVQAREPFMKMQWKIGNVQIDNPFVLAPMAGVTDLPFRTLCKEQGAGLICMEMISAKAISFHNKNTIALMEIDPCEHPVSMQLFGSEPDLMAEVAKSIEDRDFDILDINMGCPVPKVVNNGEGSALLKNPNLIEEIVRKVSSAISKPLTVKVRIGFENEPVDIVEIAKRIEDAGAAALAVHGRTRQQYYSGTADWDTIRRVKEAITIPVIGNGDVDSPLKAEALVKQVHSTFDYSIGETTVSGYTATVTANITTFDSDAILENYQKELDKFLETIKKENRVPRLFLHSCCAPCSSYVLEYLSKYFNITVFYYNPNIYPEEEYRKRVHEITRLVNSMEFEHPVKLIEGHYDPQEFFQMAKGLEDVPEGGERCFKCYRLRMEEAAKLAEEGGYDYFTTTLSISPLKNAAKINEIGEELAEIYHVQHLPSDFKKKNGYKRSIELSHEYDLYRQNYCGCVYSRREAENRK